MNNLFVGFSTGALAKQNFKKGLKLNKNQNAVELSALREDEFDILINNIPNLKLNHYKYVSLHAPTQLKNINEINLIKKILETNLPTVVHPNIINDEKWNELEDNLLIENMDNRKTVGQTPKDLQLFFDKFPKALLCLDIGHCCQIDPTGQLTAEFLSCFHNKLAEIHLSYVDESSCHKPINDGIIQVCQKVSKLIPENTPIILESVTEEVEKEVEIAKTCFLGS